MIQKWYIYHIIYIIYNKQESKSLKGIANFQSLSEDQCFQKYF